MTLAFIEVSGLAVEKNVVRVIYNVHLSEKRVAGMEKQNKFQKTWLKDQISFFSAILVQ